MLNRTDEALWHMGMKCSGMAPSPIPLSPSGMGQGCNDPSIWAQVEGLGKPFHPPFRLGPSIPSKGFDLGIGIVMNNLLDGPAMGWYCSFRAMMPSRRIEMLPIRLLPHEGPDTFRFQNAAGWHWIGIELNGDVQYIDGDVGSDRAMDRMLNRFEALGHGTMYPCYISHGDELGPIVRALRSVQWGMWPVIFPS